MVYRFIAILPLIILAGCISPEEENRVIARCMETTRDCIKNEQDRAALDAAAKKFREEERKAAEKPIIPKEAVDLVGMLPIGGGVGGIIGIIGTIYGILKRRETAEVNEVAGTEGEATKRTIEYLEKKLPDVAEKVKAFHREAQELNGTYKKMKAIRKNRGL